MTTKNRRKPGADQLLLFADDEVPDQEEPEQPWSPLRNPSKPSSEDLDGKPQPGIRAALRHRQEEWDRRRDEDPEGVAAEEAQQRAEVQRLRKMLLDNRGAADFIIGQQTAAMRVIASFPSQSQMLALGKTHENLQRAAGLAPPSSITERFSTLAAGAVMSPNLNFLGATETLTKGMTASVFSGEKWGKVVSDLSLANAGISRVAEEVSRGLTAAVAPTLAAQKMVHQNYASAFTPGMLASFAGVGDALTRQIELVATAISEPRFQATLAGIATRNKELMGSIGIIASGFSVQHQALSAALAAVPTPVIDPRVFASSKVVFPDFTSGLRDVLAGLPQSLIDELATPASPTPDEFSEERTTLGNTGLVTPSPADTQLLETEARRLGFSARSQQVFLHIADSIAALPAEMQEAYANKSNQSLIAMLVFLAALSTGNAVGFLALSGGYYGTVKPILDHFFKGE